MTSACPACDSSQLSLIGEKNACTVHRCLACQTAFVSHYNAAEQQALYTDYAPTANYASKAEKKLRRSRRRLAWLKKHFGGKRFLDVGCNIGITVEAAREQGYEAHGHDLDPVAIDLARKHYPHCQFHTGDLGALPAPFDLIYCAEVIEHVTDPHAFAAQLARLVTPGGTLFLTTPDGGHWRVPRDFMAWDEVKPPEHLLWFNKNSLKVVLEKAGFKDVHFRLNIKPGMRCLAKRA